MHNTLVNTSLLKWANNYQKEKYFPMLCKDTVGSFCLSEASSGSDAFALKCRAVEKADHFVLDGSKMWISNSQEAGLFVVFANAAPEKGYKGITAFIVHRDTPGFSIPKIEVYFCYLSISYSVNEEYVLDRTNWVFVHLPHVSCYWKE